MLALLFSPFLLVMIPLQAEQPIDGQSSGRAPSPPKSIADRCPNGFADPDIYRYLSPEPEIVYPLEALQRELEGEVEMRLIVGCDGVVKQCGILTSSGHRVLDEQACQIMGRKAFEPPRDAEGQPREGSYATSLTFNLG